VVKKGMSGAEEIAAIMKGFRENPPEEINGSKVTTIKDYQLSIEKDVLNGKDKRIELPKSNVLQFFLEDGSKISMRPSGTEPKIKFYFSVKGKLDQIDEFDQKKKELEDRIKQITDDLQL